MLDVIRAMVRRLHMRLFAAVLLLPLVALATATGGVGLRCRITGALLSACCCDDGEAVEASSVATVSQADCCDRVVRDVTAAPAEMSPATRALPDQTTAVAVVTFDKLAFDRDHSALRPRSETRASIRPPTVRLRLVAKSAFLI